MPNLNSVSNSSGEMASKHRQSFHTACKGIVFSSLRFHKSPGILLPQSLHLKGGKRMLLGSFFAKHSEIVTTPTRIDTFVYNLKLQFSSARLRVQDTSARCRAVTTRTRTRI